MDSRWIYGAVVLTAFIAICTWVALLERRDRRRAERREGPPCW